MMTLSRIVTDTGALRRTQQQSDEQGTVWERQEGGKEKEERNDRVSRVCGKWVRTC